MFVILLITAILLGIIYTKWALNYWSRRGVYTKPPSFPFGNAGRMITQQQTFGEMLKEFHEDIKARKLRHGGAYMLLSPFYVPTDLNIIKAILQTDHQHFVNHGTYSNERADPLSTHLFALEDEAWKKMRIKLTPTFTSAKMKMMFNTVTSCSDGLQEILRTHAQSGDVLDMKDILQRFTIDIIGSCAFGIECSSMKDPTSEFNVNGKRVFMPTLENSFRLLAAFCIPAKILTLFNARVFDKPATTFFLDMLHKTINYRESNKVSRKDFLHLLIQLKNRGLVSDDGKLFGDEDLSDGLSFNQIAAQAFVFFVAGYETSSTAMTFALYELAQQPELQQKMRQEIQQVLEKHQGQLTYDAIKDMTYMDQVINESLRKYPPIPTLFRKCNKTYKIPDSDLVIEKGTKVGISVLGLHHDPEYYPEPDKFDPERFSDVEKAKRPAMTWLPFGEGPRICIGLRFGMMQAKVGLTTILRDYDIVLHKSTEIPLQFDPKSFISLAKSGVFINVKKHCA